MAGLFGFERLTDLEHRDTGKDERARAAVHLVVVFPAPRRTAVAPTPANAPIAAMFACEPERCCARRAPALRDEQWRAPQVALLIHLSGFSGRRIFSS